MGKVPSSITPYLVNSYFTLAFQFENIEVTFIQQFPQKSDTLECLNDRKI